MSSSFSDRLYQLVISVVNCRRVERREVNLRRGLAVVPHSLADYIQGNFVALRAECPTAAADIMDQIERQPHHFSNLLQITIHFAQGIAL